MGAYLIDNPPKVQQFYRTRNRPLTGCTVLHTAESVMDTVGPDTGAEAVANFIRTRTTPGSYHDLVDSDSIVNLVPYESGAFHDGTGSNNWALSISFACSTSDWRRMTPEERAAFLRNGARAFAAQQAWRRAHGYPMTELRRISKAESDRGVSGFTYHGDRDPGRRRDPGLAPPNLFPFDEFIEHCRVALAGTPSITTTSEEDDMPQPVTAQIPTTVEPVLFTFLAAGPDAPGGPGTERGPAWLTVVADRGGVPGGGDTHARIAIRNSKGTGSWRPAFGEDWHAVLPVGQALNIPLEPGDHTVEFSDTDGPIGVCVEYAKA